MNMHVPQTLAARAEIMVNSRAALHIVIAQKNGPVNGTVQDGCVAANLLTMSWSSTSASSTTFTMVDKKTVYRIYKSADLKIDEIKDLIQRAKPYYPEYIVNDDFTDKIPGTLFISIVFPSNFRYSKFLSNPDSPVSSKPSVEIKDGVVLQNSAPLCKRSIGGKNNSCVHYLWKRSPDIALDFLSNVQQITDYWLATYGFSMGIQDCFASSEHEIAENLLNTRINVDNILQKNKTVDGKSIKLSAYDKKDKRLKL